MTMKTRIAWLVFAAAVPAAHGSAADIFHRFHHAVLVVEEYLPLPDTTRFLGTAFLVKSRAAGNPIVAYTNFHVIRGARNLRLRMQECDADVPADAPLITTLPLRDIAILALPPALAACAANTGQIPRLSSRS